MGEMRPHGERRRMMMVAWVAAAQVRRLVALARASSTAYVDALIWMSGLDKRQLAFPGRNPERAWPLDGAVRLARYVFQLFQVVFYPQILVRNLIMAVFFKLSYEAAAVVWRRIRAKVESLTAVGRLLSKYRTQMQDADTYLDFRAAEKKMEELQSQSEGALNEEEQAVVDKLNRRFLRYRNFVRNKDLRRLQFELRSDLLRKHFGHNMSNKTIREAVQRYVGIVSCAFALLASGSIPGPLMALVYDDDLAITPDVHDELDKHEEMSKKMKHSASLVELSVPFDHDGSEDGHDVEGSGDTEPSSNLLAEPLSADSQNTDRDEIWDQQWDSQGNLPGNKPDEEDMGTSALADKLERRLRVSRARYEFFIETRHSFGRSAILLSGGARMGLYHVGVVKTLMDHNMLPRVMSGSSAGSIICAVVGCLLDEEIHEQLFDPTQMNLRFFGRSDSLDDGLQSILHGTEPSEAVKASIFAAVSGDTSKGGNTLLGTMLMLLPPPYPSYLATLRRLLPRWAKSKVLLDISILETAIKSIVGDMTFQEAFDKTGRIINITATPHGGDRDVPFLLNYLSAPYVTVVSAACASCCIPGVFAPVTLMAKNIDGSLEPYNPSGLSWVDGSLESDLPMQRLGELFNINHFIVSQVNPHARILAPHEEGDLNGMSRLERSLLGTFGRTVRFCRDQARSYIKHFSNFSLNSYIFKALGKGVVKIVVQKYSGHVTLYPRFKAKDLSTLLANPSDEDYLDAILEGSRMTWSKLQSIRRRCMVEFMLDDCCHVMQQQVSMLEHRLTKLHASGAQPLRSRRDSAQLSRVSSYTVFEQNDRPRGHSSHMVSDDDAVDEHALQDEMDVQSKKDLTRHSSSEESSFREPIAREAHEDLVVDTNTASATSSPRESPRGGSPRNGSSASPSFSETSPSNVLTSKLMGRIQSVQQLSSMGAEQASEHSPLEGQATMDAVFEDPEESSDDAA